MSIIQRPRGTQDIYGEGMQYWHYLEAHIRAITALYQFTEMRTPMFERIEVFARSVGETSDIVSKEMYEFEDKGNRQMTLKPEGTAAIVRSYVENKLFALGDYQKYYYISPIFRYERQQAGRYRQHHQFGFEVYGEQNPIVDAENILFIHTFFQKLGLSDYRVKVNSLGDAESRVAYRDALQAHFKPFLPELCEDCQIRYEKNPLRILDCKKDAKHTAMASAPKMSEYLNAFSSNYIAEVIGLLDTFEIPYELDEKLVRGLDYYNHTVFEFVLNNQTSAKAGSLAGGGRYDGLVAQFEGPDKAGFGCGIGMERLILALQEQQVDVSSQEGRKIYVANIGGATCNKFAMEVTQMLRVANINTDGNILPKQMKAIFKLAERAEATDIVIIGGDEMASRIVGVRNTSTRAQEEVAVDDLVAYLT